MAAKNKLLYVDDDTINIDVFRLQFSKNFEVVTGTSGSEGLDLLNKHTDIRAVISDMRMPEMDGLEFIRRARKKFSDIKYYILTAYDITREIQEALDNKLINQYFQKPINRVRINHILEEVLPKKNS